MNLPWPFRTFPVLYNGANRTVQQIAPRRSTCYGEIATIRTIAMEIAGVVEKKRKKFETHSMVQMVFSRLKSHFLSILLRWKSHPLCHPFSMSHDLKSPYDWKSHPTFFIHRYLRYSLVLLSAWRSPRWQPHAMVLPLHRLAWNTSITLPQSHWHTYLGFFVLLCARPITVSIP